MKNKFVSAIVVFFILFTFACISDVDCRERHNLSIAAIYWNPEIPYLKEWIEYHHMVGVQHFYLYNNCCWNDNSMDVLQPYVNSGLVTVIPWLCKPDHLGLWDPGQRAAYNDALKITRGVSKWVAFIDIDEFIVPVTVRDLTTVLKKFKKYAAVSLSWQFYGTSGYNDIPPNKLLTECVIHKVPSSSWGAKCIVQPKYVDSMLVHYPESYNEKNCEKAKIHPFDAKENRGDEHWSLAPHNIRINHYWFRTNNYWLYEKLPLRNKWYPDVDNAKVWGEILNQATEVDKAIYPFIPKLKKRMGFQ